MSYKCNIWEMQAVIKARLLSRGFLLLCLLLKLLGLGEGASIMWESFRRDQRDNLTRQ